MHRGSHRNLAALQNASDSGLEVDEVFKAQQSPVSADFADEEPRTKRLILVANHLPLRARADGHGGYDFEWDEDALIGQAKEGVDPKLIHEVIYVGGLPVDVPAEAQDRLADHLIADFKCYPVFLSPDLKRRFYKGFCKQQLWPLLHYVLPTSPYSPGRFSAELWQSYVRANIEFTDRLVEIARPELDAVWLHDYHLMVLPSLLRRRCHKIRVAMFLHSAFPSSEIFRAFPRREELLRSMLNADVLGFHTFDYARHFLSCCSRMLGLEHYTKRGSILINYYGRDVHIKILPSCVKPQRYLEGFAWPDTQWRIGELSEQLRGKTVLLGFDDLDPFKGIEMKLLAFERVLDYHEDWRGRLVMVQVTNPPRGNSKETQALADFIKSTANRINTKYGDARTGFVPLIYEERPVPLHDRLALFSLAHCVVVTATRDGMNLVPYEYIVCRQGTPGLTERTSMLVVSEFVGCSPSLSGALRVNPWSIDSIADGVYSAIKMNKADQMIRHQKHWAYVESHTVEHWARNFTSYLLQATEGHQRMSTYGLGLGLDTFRMIALDPTFRKLTHAALREVYNKCRKRLILCDYDGTLVPTNQVDMSPTPEVKRLLRRLADGHIFYLVSGRVKQEMTDWFGDVPAIGIASEHGFYRKAPGETELVPQYPGLDFSWKETVRPLMQMYADSTDGTYVQEKDCGLTWAYAAADPDFGRWQATEMIDHLESVMSNAAVEVVSGHQYVEVKPKGLSKGATVRALIEELEPDFVLCLGDDKSDEEMFHTFSAERKEGMHVFACTVGQKPSQAKYYVNDTKSVVALLSQLLDKPPVPPAPSNNGL